MNDPASKDATMSDSMVKDIAGLGKLAEVLGKGVGAWARPWLIRRDAKALADAVRTLSEEGITLKGTADLGGLKLDLEQIVVERERRHLTNIAAIAEHAQAALPQKTSSEPVDEDWISRFFQDAQDISSEEMQRLWGKILAGEVAEPGSFPLRTLQVVRNISALEAHLFTQVASIAFGDFIIDPYTQFPPAPPRRPNASPEQLVQPKELADVYGGLGLWKHNLLLLEETGLLRRIETGLVKSFRRTVKNPWLVRLPYGDSLLEVRHVSEDMLLALPCIVLSTAGFQLCRLVRSASNLEVRTCVVDDLKKRGFEVDVRATP